MQIEANNRHTAAFKSEAVFTLSIISFFHVTFDPKLQNAKRTNKFYFSISIICLTLKFSAAAISNIVFGIVENQRVKLC